MLTKRAQIGTLFLLFGIFCSVIGYRIGQYSGHSSSHARQQAKQSADSTSFYRLGKLALEEGHYSEAISLLEKAKLLVPSSTHTVYTLAEAYRKKAWVDKARRTFEEVVELDPTGRDTLSLLALKKLGKLYGRNDRLQESRKAYLTALERETRPTWILHIKNQLAELDLTEGRYEDDGNTIYNEVGEVIGGVGPGDMR
ncbi:hypothetical protein MJD09_15695, partial [bacterium]|nr:hypothetical protein [bacterium]